jgi:2-hydroxy-3-oxopropionate reductase
LNAPHLEDTMAEKIGFIGLGVMGAPIARHLATKYDVTVFDIDKKKMDAVAGAGKAADIAGIARESTIVFLSLPGSEVVQDVVSGNSGLKSHMKPGSVIIDTSTTSPTVSQEIAASLSESVISFLDAPVSGGEKAAIEGTLSVMVGGKQEVFNRCLDMLNTIGTSVVLMGDTGMGGVTKLVNNLIVGITFVAVAEGFALGTKSGLDPKVLYQAIRGGWAGSKVLEVSAEAMLARNFKPGGTVDIHWKDLGYALTLARDKDVPVPATALAHEIFKAARASGRGKLAQPAIVQLWENLLNIEVGENGPD